MYSSNNILEIFLSSGVSLENVYFYKKTLNK